MFLIRVLTVDAPRIALDQRCSFAFFKSGQQGFVAAIFDPCHSR